MAEFYLEVVKAVFFPLAVLFVTVVFWLFPGKETSWRGRIRKWFQTAMKASLCKRLAWLGLVVLLLAGHCVWNIHVQWEKHKTTHADTWKVRHLARQMASWAASHPTTWLNQSWNEFDTLFEKRIRDEREHCAVSGLDTENLDKLIGLVTWANIRRDGEWAKSVAAELNKLARDL